MKHKRKRLKYLDDVDSAGHDAQAFIQQLKAKKKDK